MVEYVWPDKKDTSLLGGSHDKIDGAAKCTGTAKYSYDINPDKVLIGRILGCPHAHCKLKSLDLGPAEKVAGVVAARGMKKVGDEIQWQGDTVAVVLGETEGAVAEGLAAIQADYEPVAVAFVEVLPPVRQAPVARNHVTRLEARGDIGV